MAVRVLSDGAIAVPPSPCGAILIFRQQFPISKAPGPRYIRATVRSRSSPMQFGLFGSATARHAGPDVDSGQGCRQFVDYNIEAEALGYKSTFLVEHHFTGFGQVSASLSLLTWVAAKTKTLRLGTAVMVLPWHNPVLLAEQAATIDLLSG